MDKYVKKVIFVCLGNICRSPTGEGVMQHLVDRQGLREKVFVDSAGTAGYHTGHAADNRMQKAARRRGYELLSKARQVTREDMDEFDLVIAMDRENLNDLQRLAGGAQPHIRLLSDYLPAGHNYGDEVPDPYYGGAEGFETVLNMIEEACPYLLQALMRGESLQAPRGES